MRIVYLDLANKHPEVCREAAHRLADWHDAQMHKMARHGSDVVDPLWTVIREGGPFHANAIDGRGQPAKLHAYVERLDATGRGDGARRLRQRMITGETVG